MLLGMLASWPDIAAEIRGLVAITGIPVVSRRPVPCPWIFARVPCRGIGRDRSHDR